MRRISAIVLSLFMILKKINLLLFPIIILIFLIPTVSAPDVFTVEVIIYEAEREVIFQENQESQTIHVDGIVNYDGVSALGDTIELSSSFNLGESNISPEEVTFHTTGSEEFTVELIIPNNYENGTTGTLEVQAMWQQGGTTTSTATYAYIIIINQSNTTNSDNGGYNSNNSKTPQKDGNPLGIRGILIISIIIIIIAIIVVVIYKKISK